MVGVDFLFNDTIHQRSDGRVREMFWKSVDHQTMTKKPSQEWMDKGIPVNFNEGAWFVVDIDGTSTLVEYYAWSDPSGYIPASLTNSLAAGGIKDTIDAVGKIAAHGPIVDLIRCGAGESNKCLSYQAEAVRFMSPWLQVYDYQSRYLIPPWGPNILVYHSKWREDIGCTRGKFICARCRTSTNWSYLGMTGVLCGRIHKSIRVALHLADSPCIFKDMRRFCLCVAPHAQTLIANTTQNGTRTPGDVFTKRYL